MKTCQTIVRRSAAETADSNGMRPHLGRGHQRRAAGIVAALFALGGVGCGSGSSGSSGLTMVPEGSWAGTGIGLQVSRTTSTVMYGCGSGTIDQPLVVDSTGHFDVTGSTSPGSPIAVVPVPPATTFPTRYAGSTDGQTMQLTTIETLPNGVVTNSYILTFGKQFNGPLCVR